MELGDQPLTLEGLESIVFDREPVALSPAARDRVETAADYIESRADSGDEVYGVTTGFGANRRHSVAPEDAERLQTRLLASHAAGMGDPLSVPVVRAMMVLRANALAGGHSGIRLPTLELLLDMVDAGVHPVVPRYGSVGASGDLCPLAHMALPLVGEGEVTFEGERLSGRAGLQRAGLEPVDLVHKEGLALLNGTQAQTAVGAVTALRARRLATTADGIAAMSLEACAGRREAFDPRVHRLRGSRGQSTTARIVRAMLEDSQLAGAEPGEVEGKDDYVQDSYCLRCVPQVHGATRRALSHVEEVLETEAEAVTDNPLVFPPDDDEPGAILSGGNFHGQPVALALDYLKTAVAELGNIAERRCAKLTDPNHSEGLPPFLTDDPGLNSGMMIPQYVAASLVSENKSQAFPSSVDSIPTSANMEDHVSMGMHAALSAATTADHLTRILGIEWVIAAQALDLRRRSDVQLGRGTERLRARLREEVAFLEEDRQLHADLERAAEMVEAGRAAAIVDDVADPPTSAT